MDENDITLIILAGGEGTRMQPVSLITPKPLLSTFDEPLLIRQIRHAKKAGISKVLVSTNPKDFEQIKKTLSYFNLKAHIIKNPKHAQGSLPALSYSLNTISTSKVLMSFADIYFMSNPFSKFKNESRYRIGISKAFDPKELSLGGIIFTKGKFVEKIVEKPIVNNIKGHRWNGLVLFKKSDQITLDKFLKSNRPDSPEGDFFEYLRTDKNIIFSTTEGLDFININRPENLMTASIYRYSEVSNDAKIISLAKQIRRYNLEKAK